MRSKYFVSYYDYYQPEAYVPRATCSSRRIRASTSNRQIAPVGDQNRCSNARTPSSSPPCPASTASAIGRLSRHDLHLREREKLSQRDIIARLTAMQYQRNEFEFARGTFRVRGDVLDVFRRKTPKPRCASA